MTPEKWRAALSTSVSVDMNSDEIEFTRALAALWDYIATRRAQIAMDRTTQEEEAPMSKNEQNEILRGFIKDFIEKKTPRVKGYVKDGKLDLRRLYQVFDEIITGYDVLNKAMLDPTITEIQINSYNSIWVERKGKFMRYIDDFTNEPVVFRDVSSCMSFINTLLMSSSTQLDSGHTKALGNSITPEGYRVAAIGPGAMAAEKGKDVLQEKSPACVIRKFSDNVITGEDLIRNYTHSDQMNHFEGLLGDNHATVIVGGSTGCGKTVNLQRIIDGISNGIRVISMEKDSELRLRRYNADGILINNVIQLEYLQEDKNIKYAITSNTSSNLFNQLLRFTPSTIIFGECRSPEEISLLLVGVNAGHNVMATLHTDNAAQAIERMTQAQMITQPGASKADVMETICTAVDIIVIPARMADGTRKILEIAEIEGCYVEDGIARPKVNQLYKFQQTGFVNGVVYGEHVQVNSITPALLEKWSRKGMDPETYAFLSAPVPKDANGKTIPIKGTYFGKRNPNAVPPTQTK